MMLLSYVLCQKQHSALYVWVSEERPLSFLFQAGTVRGRGRAGATNRGPGPRGSYLGGYSAGRGIYSRYHEGKTKLPEKPYELMSSLELAAVNPVGIKPGTSQCDTLKHTHILSSTRSSSQLSQFQSAGADI